MKSGLIETGAHCIPSVAMLLIFRSPFAHSRFNVVTIKSVRALKNS